jgi:phosphoglycolate phosphatase-like HAD superfamily hydrolase
MKLAPHGLDRYFPIGAYGSDARRRSDLPAIALERAREATGRSFRGKEIVIIGDTPHDITCGAHLNVRTIAVATGGADHTTLESYHPDALFHSLADTAGVLDAIRN